MRIQVDRDRCRGIGVCESLCPDVFEVGEDGVLELVQDVVVASDLVPEVETAIISCPTGALGSSG